MKEEKRKIEEFDEEIKNILNTIKSLNYCIQGVDLKDTVLLPYERTRALVKTFPCILKNKMKFVRLCYILQREYEIEMDLCSHFEIRGGDYKTFCHSNLFFSREVSLEKKEKQKYCCPINHGNCVLKKEQKKNGNKIFHAKIFFLTARSVLLED